MAAEKCRICKFWVPLDHRSDEAPESAVFGECRRHAPQPTVVVGEIVDNQTWPRVQLDDWCGEFKVSMQKKVAIAKWEAKRLVGKKSK
jgi:hypothetical protein